MTKSPDPIDIQVGQRIRIERNARGLSQSALAKGLGVTFQQVQKYEKGANRVGAGRLTRIANVLGISAARLLGVNDGPRSDEVALGRPPVLECLAIPGAVRLLQAYAQLSAGGLRSTVVKLVEEIVNENQTSGSASMAIDELARSDSPPG